MPLGTALGLLALAVAAGLGPYSSIVTLGLLAYLGVSALPPQLAGLSHPGILAVSTALLVLDASVSRPRLADLLWNALHTLVRPAAAALLVVSAGVGLHAAAVWLTALGGAAAGFLAHLLVLGARSAARTAGPVSFLPGFTALRIAGAGFLTTLSLLAPPVAGAFALVLVLAPLPWLPRLWGAGHMTLAACLHALTRAGRGWSWLGGDAGPSPRIKRLLAEGGDEDPERVRVCPATLGRDGHRWAYACGLLILGAGRGPVFARRRRGRWKIVELGGGPGRSDEGALLETVEIRSERPYTLCLDASAPPGSVVLAELEGTRSVPGIAGTR